jgi:SAM-dependent methyltransferase
VPEDLDGALAAVRELLASSDLLRAVAAGRRRGSTGSPAADSPQRAEVQRAELRPVALRSGVHLQVVTTDGLRPTTRNYPVGSAEAEAALDELLTLPFGNWHVETADQVRQLRVTKRGQAQVHVARTSRRDVAPAGHDRPAEHLLPPDDELFTVLGAGGDKRRQVDAFLRQLAAVLERPAAAAAAAGRPLRVVDLGCGNAYLTFAAHRYLMSRCEDLGLTGVQTVGVDSRPDMVERNRRVGQQLSGSDSDGDPSGGAGGSSSLSFVTSTIADADADADVRPPDLVLALHACDTATDDALAAAVRWRAAAILAAPCCHHDLQRQLLQGQRDGGPPPFPYGAVLRHPILRERWADVLTDTMRAELLRLLGYRVEVVEFVDSRHTPRNALLRAVRTAAAPTVAARDELAALVEAWQVRPELARLLEPELTAAAQRLSCGP